jgi:hypothetical protein
MCSYRTLVIWQNQYRYDWAFNIVEKAPYWNIFIRLNKQQDMRKSMTLTEVRRY